MKAPISEDIRAARKHAGDTQEQAGQRVYAGRRTWQDWENGVAQINLAAWELYLIKTGQSTTTHTPASQTQAQ